MNRFICVNCDKKFKCRYLPVLQQSNNKQGPICKKCYNKYVISCIKLDILQIESISKFLIVIVFLMFIFMLYKL